MKRLFCTVLAVLMIFSSTVFAVPTAAPVVESSVEFEIAVNETTQETLADEVPETTVLAGDEDRFPKHPQYGVMLYNIDFDMSKMESSVIKSGTYTQGGAEEFKFLPLGTIVNKLGAINPAVAEDMNSKIDINLESTTELVYQVGSNAAPVKGLILVTGEDGDTYAKLDATAKWPNVYVRALNKSENGDTVLYEKNGIFTLNGDLRIDKSVNSTEYYATWSYYEQILTNKEDSSIVTRTGEQLNGSSVAIPSDGLGEWRNITTVFNKNGKADVTYNGALCTREWNGMRGAKYGFSFGGVPAETTPVYLDDLKLYWKPFTADLTVDMNGNTVATPIAGLTDYDTTKLVDISALEAKVIDHGDKIFKGFSFTANGEIIKDDFYLTEDTTIYAIWHTYKKNSYSLDMDTEKNMQFSSTGTVGKANNGSFVEALAEGETKFVRFNFRSKDGNRAMQIDTNFNLQSSFGSNLPISNIDAIQIRMRISEVPDFLKTFAESYTSDSGFSYPAATSSTYYVQSYGGNNYSMNSKSLQQNIYFYTNDGQITGLTETRNEKIYPALDVSPGGAHADKWVTIYFDCDEKCVDDDTGVHYWTNSTRLKAMRFDFANSMIGGMYADFDYIHFIEREDNPANEEKTSIRTKDYTGIRFLASIKNQIKNNADEYGFLVTRKVILDAAGFTGDDLCFALDQTKAPYVSKASYSKATGEDFVYAVDEDSVYFTGLMTNIPENMLDDVLVVRPYSKVGGEYAYGNYYSSSVVETAEKAYNNGYCDASGNPLSDETVAYLKKVLSMYKKPYELDAIESYNAEELTPYTNFFADKCTIEIVEDPEDPTNHVYKMTPNAGSSYTYFWFSTGLSKTVQNGAQYTVSAKVKLVSDALYSKDDGKIVTHTITFDDAGNAYYINKDNKKCYLAIGGLVQTDKHYGFAGECKLRLDKYASSVTKKLYRSTKVSYEDGHEENARFGFYYAPFQMRDEGLGVMINYKFAVYVDDIVVRKTADPVIAE